LLFLLLLEFGCRPSRWHPKLCYCTPAAPYTVCKSRLLPKLWAAGIRGKTLKWFESYLSGGEQSVVWGGTILDTLSILYGVRQKRFSGPCCTCCAGSRLALGLSTAVGNNNGGGNVVAGDTGYADDTRTWAIGDSLAEVMTELHHLAEAFSFFTRNNGLALNGGKTQLLIGDSHLVRKEDLAKLEIVVDGAVVRPSDTLELLGVSFDRKLTVRPYVTKLAKRPGSGGPGWRAWPTTYCAGSCCGNWVVAS
jgi:hypothetical protein